MDDPDVVDTSDVEEREVLVTSDDADLWANPVSTPPFDMVIPQSASMENVYQPPDLGLSSPLTSITRHDRFGDREGDSVSPRKRIKIAHEGRSVSSDFAFSIENPLLNASLPKEAPCPPSKRFAEDIPVDDDNEQSSVPFSACDISPHTDWHSLFSSPSRFSPKSISSDATIQAGLHSMGSPCPPSLSHSLSGPTHCYPPLSSVRHRPTTPPQTSSQCSHGQSNFARRCPPSVVSSPLTPVSSPARIAQTHLQSPDPLQLFSSPHPQFTHFARSQFNLVPPIPPPVRSSPIAEVPDDPQPLGRYALRRREARQLNPYAYDKLLYKQQLKFHPDAIVKFRSPRGRPSSGEVDANGTQNESVLSLGNLDEDADYVNVEGESSGGRRRVQRSKQREGQEPETRQVEEGWLPETLQGLSSSDEDDKKIGKLVQKVRRERERAEALFRAEARKAAAKARQTETEASKAVKRRPKPFPVHEDSEHGHTRIYDGPSSSSSLFSRAHSLHGPSPTRSPFRPPSPSRMCSHTLTSNSNPLRSPDFSVYLEQEDSYCHDDYDVLFPRNNLPAHHSTTNSASPSPTGSPTTSGASVLPSNASGMDSESDHPFALEMNSKDRRRLRALKRMMPAAMIARQLRTSNTAHPPPPRSRLMVESSGSEAEEVRVIPGLAIARKGKYRDVEVRGDPESSDAEKLLEAVPGPTELFSDEQSIIRVRQTRHISPRLRVKDEVISLSDNSLSGSFSEDSGGHSEDERSHHSMSSHPAKGPTHERSLIDWMLSRTRGPSRPKSERKRPTRSRSCASGRPKLNIVSSGARRHGGHQQTLLPFARADKGSLSTMHASEHQDRIAQFGQDTVDEGKKPKKRWKFRTNQGPIYSIHHDATRITSRHQKGRTVQGKTSLIIQNHDSEFRRALDPGWAAEVERWNKPASPARHSVANLTTLAAPQPRIYRRTSPRLKNELSLPFYFQHEEGSFTPVHRQIVVDMNITPFPSGIKFGASSYIERGLLHQLISVISGNLEVAPPMTHNMQGFEIGPTTSAVVFTALLGPLCDRFATALRNSRGDEVDTMKEWEAATHATCQLLSWLVVHAEDEEFVVMGATLRECTDGLSLVLGSLETTMFSLAAHWFVVELSARLVAGVKERRGSMETGYFMLSAKQLMQRLRNVDLQQAFATFHTTKEDVYSLSQRAVELWVCLIHLLPSLENSTEPVPGHPLWRLLAELHPESSPTGAEASEDIWRMIFSLCAISQFSVHGLTTSVFRLPAAWELVTTALKKIILTSNPEKEHQLPRRALKKRDDYVLCVVSRCFLLWSQWGWRLDDGIIMFKSLQEIFRSRNFANLLNERSAPMGFLENGDLELLSKRDSHDSAFEIFLKMVVQAVYLFNRNVDQDAKQRLTHIKKLLQMAVPVSPVPFSRSAPPSTHTLSMLVNRFSAMVIAVHLDPTSSNVKFRIGQAKRCVSFKDADDHSRVACVYGMMNFAMVIRHHKIVRGLEEILGWLGEMADVLMDEYKGGETGTVWKKPTTTLIQLLIGSVRRVIETPSLDKEQVRADYPDPALLDGPWVTRVFNPRTDLVTIQQTGVEIRMLVQSFLNARLKALPPSITHTTESQESQDEYDKLVLDLNDEELLAALGEEAEASAVADLKSKEDALCKVLDKSITPAVYRLVCRYFGEGEHATSDTNNRAADEWIDCWVGCASVLVQNNYKDWGLYMKLGQQSWEKIIDSTWRRRAGLRFNLTLLRLDPGAYYKRKDDFIPVLLVAALSSKTTIEHEFISVVLSLDGLRHPLLRAVPLDPTPGTRKYEVSEAEYGDVRGRLIETVLANTAGCLHERVDAQSQTYAEMIVMMLSTMREIYQSTPDKANYGEFCRSVIDMLKRHGELESHPRMSDAVGWDWSEVS